MEPIHTSDTNFANDVLKSSQPVLVDFWAEWCGPCKALAPKLDEIAKEYTGKIRVAKVDIDQNKFDMLNNGKVPITVRSA